MVHFSSWIMNISIVAIIATTLALSGNIELTKAEMESYDMLLSECAAQEGATISDIQKVGMEVPTTKTGKCLNACILEQLGLMQNRKLDVATSIEMVKREISDDPETIRIVTQISNECAEVTDEDRCEAAYKIIVCTEEASAALGLTFDR